jgi:hypothetical protein
MLLLLWKSVKFELHCCNKPQIYYWNTIVHIHENASLYKFKGFMVFGDISNDYIIEAVHSICSL